MSTPNPLPSLSIGGPEQVAAELLAMAIIKSKSTNAEKLAAAQTFQQVASIFTDGATGNVTDLNAKMNAFVAGISDPGIQVVAASAMGWAQPFIDAEVAALKGAPGIGLMLEGGLTAGAAGFKKIAAAYIAKYGKPAA